MKSEMHIARKTVAIAVTGLALVLAAGLTASPQPKPDIGGALEGAFFGGEGLSQEDLQIYADAAGGVYRLWVDSWKREGGDVRFQRSVDDGQTWAEAIVLDRDKGKAASTSPTLAVDGAGRLLAMWRTKLLANPGGKEIQFRMSPDRGATWPGPVQVLNHGRQGLSGTLSGDRQGHVYAVWYDERSGPARRSRRSLEVFFNRSEDFGRLWLADDARLSGKEIAPGGRSISSQPKVQSDDKGRVYVAWVDGRSGRTEILARASDDHGKSWGPEIIVSRGALSASRHQLLTDGAGRVFLIWHDNRLGPFDVFFARSEDGGKQWSEPARLSRGRPGAAVSAAPHMAVARDGHVYAVWHDTRNGREDIYANISSDWGRTWLDKDIRLDRDDAGTGVSQFPQVVVGPDGTVAVAWADDRTGFKRILLTRSVDRGKTWLDREISVDKDTPPAEQTQSVKLAAGAPGVIHVMWEVARPEALGAQKRVAYRRVVLPQAMSTVAPPLPTVVPPMPTVVPPMPTVAPPR